jgi:hypothetical protein
MPCCEDIITDADVLWVHANANFGSTPPRRVVDEGVLKAALGYHSGSTATAILYEHGLTRKPRRYGDRPELTQKGRSYLLAMLSTTTIDGLLKTMGR